VAKSNEPLFNIGNNPNLDAADTGVDPSTGEVLTNQERKRIFKKRKINVSKVFGRSGAIEKFDNKDKKNNPVVNSIINIRQSLGKLSNFIVDEAKEKKKALGRSLRLFRLRRERKKRQNKEGLLEGVGEKMKNALLSPIKKVGEQAKGILGKLMEAFQLIFVGWLTNKGFKAIEAFMSGDKEKLKSIGMNVLAGLGIVGGIFVAMNVGLLALPMIIAKVISVIATVGSAIIGFLLSPPGLITLAIAAGIGAAILGILKLNNIIRGGDDASNQRKENRLSMKEQGVEKAHISGLFGKRYNVTRDGEKVKLKYSELTPKEQGIVDQFEAEDQRIKDVTKQKNKDLYEGESRIRKERESIAIQKFGPKSGLGSSTQRALFDKETERLIKEEKARIKGEATGSYANDGSSITPVSSNNVNISSSTVDRNLGKINNGEPKVTVNNLQGQGQGDQPLKSGDQTNVPLISSSDSNNMYKSFSQTQYGVVV
tara:strand:- start:31 stop:1479 length:1449 start_codon:yes stop_codon:yes gene_type:complete